MMLGRFQSTRDPKNPLMRIAVRQGRHPIKAATRVTQREPREITLRGSDRTVAYICPSCSMLLSPDQYHGGTRQDRLAAARNGAIHCCDARCQQCGTPVKKYHSRCCDCSEKRMAQERRAWAARAEPCTLADTDWIYADGYGSSYGDGYFPSMDELVEWCRDEGVDLPAYVHPCNEITVSVDAAEIYERIDEEVATEDSASERLSGCAEFEAAIDAFNAANAGPMAWTADFRRVIILDEAKFNAEFGNDVHGRPITSWSDRPPTVDAITLAKYRKIVEGRSDTEAA